MSCVFSMAPDKPNRTRVCTTLNNVQEKIFNADASDYAFGSTVSELVYLCAFDMITSFVFLNWGAAFRTRFGIRDQP